MSMVENPSVGTTYLLCSIQSELVPLIPSKKIRAMSCYIKDVSDGSFIRFEILMDNVEKKGINYIKIDNKNLSNRPVSSSYAEEIYIKINRNSRSYVILSPEDPLYETDDKELASFSYPLDTIFYKSYGGFNKEEYDFFIVNYSPSFVSKYISLINVPNFNKIGVILIDRSLYSEIKRFSSLTLTIYAVIRVIGKTSGNQNDYIIKFIL